MYSQQNQGPRNISKRLNDYWARVAEQGYYVPDVFGRRIVHSFMLKLKPQSLIEVGCGTGELFSAFKDIPRVMAVDWQTKMLEQSRERIERHGYVNIQLQQLDITQPLQPSSLDVGFKFDVALTRTVLMHIAPEDVEAACHNMTLLSDTVLAFEFFSPTRAPETLAHHNWHHDYPSIFKALGYSLVEAYERPDDVNQILFHFKRDADEKNRDGKPGTEAGGSRVSDAKSGCEAAL